MRDHRSLEQVHEKLGDERDLKNGRYTDQLHISFKCDRTALFTI
jgi:hypothetical protein